MTLFTHELKRNSIALLIWTYAISFMLGICVIIYPEMSSQMGEISDMFANMGAFSDAFGMDQLNFGEFMGYFAIDGDVRDELDANPTREAKSECAIFSTGLKFSL